MDLAHDVEMMAEINHALLDMAHEKLCCLDDVCAKEYGEIIDMIDDLSEAMYHVTTVEAMKAGATTVTHVVTPSPTV